MSEKQAQILKVEAYTRWSPYLTKCCLLLSANESYARTAEDIEVLTGVAVSHSTQQRLVHSICMTVMWVRFSKTIASL